MPKSNLMVGVALAGGLALAGAGVVLAGSHGAGKPADAATQMMEKDMQQGMQMMKEMAGGDAGKVAAEMMKKTGMGQMAKDATDTTGKAVAGKVEDGRTLVEMPEPQRSDFLAIMRGFMEQLDDIINAAAEGNFKEVARIARGNRELISAMRAAGVPDEKIREVEQRIRLRMEEALKGGNGRVVIGPILQEVLGAEMMSALITFLAKRPVGYGKPHLPLSFMPAKMRLTGLRLSLAMAKLADVAAGIGEKPTAEDYGKVLAAIGEVTTQCRGCHAAWKVMP